LPLCGTFSTNGWWEIRVRKSKL
jgi:Recombinase.